MAKLILTKGAIAVQRGRDAHDEPVTFVVANLSPKIEIVKGTHLGIPMEEKDLRFTTDDLSPEAKKAVELLISEVEGKVKAAAQPRAAKLASDGGFTLET